MFKPRYFYETSVTSFQFDVISSHFWFWSKICLFLRSNYFGISVKNFIQTQSVFEVVAEEMVASSPIFPYSIAYIGVTSGMFPYWTFSIFVVPFYLALVCCVLSLEKWIFKCLLVILPILRVCSIFHKVLWCSQHTPLVLSTVACVKTLNMWSKFEANRIYDSKDLWFMF